MVPANSQINKGPRIDIRRQGIISFTWYRGRWATDINKYRLRSARCVLFLCAAVLILQKYLSWYVRQLSLYRGHSSHVFLPVHSSMRILRRPHWTKPWNELSLKQIRMIFHIMFIVFPSVCRIATRPRCVCISCIESRDCRASIHGPTPTWISSW